MRLLVAGLAMLAFAACGKRIVQPDLPDSATAVVPEVQVVERVVYVPIPASLLRAEPIAEGPITQCFAVAAQRRAALERCNAKLKQAGAIQGTEAKP